MSPARLFTAQEMAHVQKYTESIQWSQWATNVFKKDVKLGVQRDLGGANGRIRMNVIKIHCLKFSKS